MEEEVVEVDAEAVKVIEEEGVHQEVNQRVNHGVNQEEPRQVEEAVKVTEEELVPVETLLVIKENVEELVKEEHLQVEEVVKVTDLKDTEELKELSLKRV